MLLLMKRQKSFDEVDYQVVQISELEVVAAISIQAVGV